VIDSPNLMGGERVVLKDGLITPSASDLLLFLGQPIMGLLVYLFRASATTPVLLRSWPSPLEAAMERTRFNAGSHRSIRII
jgi:hypothetical protein